MSRKTPTRVSSAHMVGDQVYAKWPQSDLWFPCQVLDNRGPYKVQLSDGSVQTVPLKHVASQGRFRTRSKSPGRSRSRSRSRGRSRSPARTRKPKESPSPSPARQRKTPPRESKPPTTPTRVSARIAAFQTAKEEVKEVVKEEDKEEKPQNTEEFIPKMPAKAQEILLTGKPTDKAKVGRTTDLEFGGPVGAFFMILALPAVVLLLNLACSGKSCTIQKIPKISLNCKDYFDLRASLIFFGWLAFQVLLSLLPVGRVVEGQPLRTGEKLKYRLNGFFALVVSSAAFGLAVYMKVHVGYVYEKFLQLAVTAILFSFVLSVFLYIKSKTVPNNQLASGGNSGNLIYDFWIGRELNPRIGPLDLKFFCELRPGLIGWVMINLCFIAHECTTKHNPSPALLLVSAFQIWYVADALWYEEAILTTMDIIHDGFGYMLVHGDLAWLPFLYTLQTRFLVDQTQQWMWYELTGFAVLNIIGYIIFRGSNSQKNEFRKNPYNPALAHLESIPTRVSDRRLLVSGWWGLSRHPNYFGDLIMALSWSLPCGFGHILPYFYPIYFLMLLVHRSLRDEKNCREKYGPAWDVYTERVKYRIFPYIF